MRIAQISPLYESVPPQAYGGTERIVSYITQELINRNHQVTLFASGDSKTDAELIAICPKSLRLYGEGTDHLAYHFLEMHEVIKHAGEFDILHFHTDYLHFPVSSMNMYNHITTLHGRLNIKGLDILYKIYNDIPLVSISDYQRKPLPDANWIKTVYHGLPSDLLKPVFTNGSYLAFLGRISPEKRVDRAIEIAIQTGITLKIAAKIDVNDQEYFDSEIKHLFNHPLVEYIGEINEKEKQLFLGNALALLFPIDWPEPFGLVMIESMACATPVIAFKSGSVPEVIDEGITGYIVHSIDEAVNRIERLDGFDRVKCRQKFDERFDAKIMVDNYIKAYLKVININSESKKHYNPFL
jgi:glycosyltransferase involved in cell wall biosynthesis